MGECKLCQQGDPAITVRCHNCRQLFHLHQCQVDKAPEESIILGDCPSCQVVNCWMKHGGEVNFSGPVIYDGQPILNLRGKR
ncbi:hypothetical protein ES708_17701 [subsurface metagenome]